MKALVLAGGLGTRLRPLTYTRPKHLLPIVNRPHVEHVFDLLTAHGIEETILLTSYLAEQFDEVVAAARERGLAVTVTHEPEPLGTAGALKNAAEFVGDETFIALNGDVLTALDLGALVAWHRARGAIGTIALTPVEDPSAYGVVPTEQDGRVTGFIEKPPSGEAPTNLINAGTYVLEPEVLERIPKEEVWSAERQLFPALVAEGAPLYARGSDDYWIDIGTPEKFLQANLDALAGRWVPRDFDGAGGVVLAPDAVVAGRARVSSACLGSEARVDDDALVENAVLMPRAHVEAGASVRASILGAGARVRAGSTVTGATLADGEIV